MQLAKVILNLSVHFLDYVDKISNGFEILRRRCYKIIVGSITVDFSLINSKLQFVATSSFALIVRLTLPFVLCTNFSLNVGTLVINNHATFNIYTRVSSK